MKPQGFFRPGMTTFDDDSVMLAAAQVYDDDGDYLLDEAWQYKVSVNFLQLLLKLSRNKKDHNDVTAAPFSVFFLLLVAEKRHQKWGSYDVIKVLLIS